MNGSVKCGAAHRWHVRGGRAIAYALILLVSAGAAGCRSAETDDKSRRAQAGQRQTPSDAESSRREVQNSGAVVQSQPRLLGESVPITQCNDSVQLRTSSNQRVSLWVSLDSVLTADRTFGVKLSGTGAQFVDNAADLQAGVKGTKGAASVEIPLRIKNGQNGDIEVTVWNEQASSVKHTYYVRIIGGAANPQQPAPPQQP